MVLSNAFDRLRKGLTVPEHVKYRTALAHLTARLDQHDPEYSRLEREIALGILRDIQAQRLPPNVRVPPRSSPVAYLDTVHGELGSWVQTIQTYLSPGSWASSGGSFKLAEDAGYDLPEFLIGKARTGESAVLVEVGAGYAGFKSTEPKGIRKLVERVAGNPGTNVESHFTNLTQWHAEDLPAHVHEHPHLLARDIAMLSMQGVRSADVVYSQCAAYFEPRIGDFVTGAAMLLNPGGLLLFNADTAVDSTIRQRAATSGLQLEREVILGGMNGTLYAFRK